MPKQTRVKPTLREGAESSTCVHETTKFMSCMLSGSVPTNYYRDCRSLKIQFYNASLYIWHIEHVTWNNHNFVDLPELSITQ